MTNRAILSRGGRAVVGKQAEFLLGPVGVVEGGAACGDCGFDLPSDATICPACGVERKAYPSSTVARFGWVLEQPIGDPNAKLVLIALVAHDLPGGDGIFPSQARLAAMTGLNRRSVIRALLRLRQAGWVMREKSRRRDGRQGGNRYTIHQPGLAVPECQKVTLARVTESHTKG